MPKIQSSNSELSTIAGPQDTMTNLPVVFLEALHEIQSNDPSKWRKAAITIANQLQENNKAIAHHTFEDVVSTVANVFNVNL